MEPRWTAICGHDLLVLIGNVGLLLMDWPMTRGNLPSDEDAALLEAALVAAVDRGLQAPSIATAGMIVTC